MSKKKIFFLSFLTFLFFASFYLSYFIRKNFFKEPLNYQKIVSFLILGIRGFNNNGDDLTDTIILVFLNPKTQKPVFLSIPRDLWIDPLKTKINTLYHYGGILLVQKTISEILDQPIDHYLIVDFSAFEKIIDTLGGITVDVQKSFDDYYYPIPGKENDPCNGDKEYRCRYEHLHFNAGPQLMDGATALKYARSRHAEGEEGTDFARSLRQQQLLLALKQKIFSHQVLFSPKKIKKLSQIVQESLITDIKKNEYGNLLLLLSQINFQNSHLQVLDGSLLINPKQHSSGQWILIPPKGDWSEIRHFVKNLLEDH